MSFMPDHARWFATSAEGLAGADAAASASHAQRGLAGAAWACESGA